MRAVLGFNQSGIDGRRERRIIQGRRQVRPVRLADFLPRRTDLVVASDDAVVWGVLALLVVGNDFDLDVTRTLFDYQNKSTEVYWWQRRKFLGLRIGRKDYYQKVLPECGEILTRSIEIKKK